MGSRLQWDQVGISSLFLRGFLYRVARRMFLVFCFASIPRILSKFRCGLFPLVPVGKVTFPTGFSLLSRWFLAQVS